MRHKRFRLTNLAWITAAVTGLLLSVAAPTPLAGADPGGWDPTLPAQVSAGAPASVVLSGVREPQVEGLEGAWQTLGMRTRHILRRDGFACLWMEGAE